MVLMLLAIDATGHLFAWTATRRKDGWAFFWVSLGWLRKMVFSRRMANPSLGSPVQAAGWTYPFEDWSPLLRSCLRCCKKSREPMTFKYSRRARVECALPAESLEFDP